MVRMDRPESANAVIKGIDDQFRNAPLQTKTETEKAFQLSFLAFRSNVNVFLLSIRAAVTFTILLVTGNTMAMAVRERTREVGVLKTLGFTPGIIVGLLVGEALVTRNEEGCSVWDWPLWRATGCATGLATSPTSANSLWRHRSSPWGSASRC
jgi:hypothetical protein